MRWVALVAMLCGLRLSADHSGSLHDACISHRDTSNGVQHLSFAGATGLFTIKNGGHATLALVNERACLTCHTFENTCASCHKRTFR